MRAALLNPADVDELARRVPGVIYSPDMSRLGFPVGYFSGMQVYAHESQPRGEALEGPREAIEKIVRGRIRGNPA